MKGIKGINMKEIIINSFDELSSLVFEDCYDDEIHRYRNNIVYRGVGDKTYGLDSKLNRICSHNLQLEKSIIRSFRKYGYADLKDSSSYWALIATGQHYGLPTRLLDWSYSPFVAAHFATEDIYEYDKDGAIYMVDLKDSYKTLPDCLKEELDKASANSFTLGMIERHALTLEESKNLSEEPFFLFYEPLSSDSRIANQYALFSCCSDTRYSILDLLNNDKDNSLKKIIIPKEIKMEIRDKLDYINISERLLHPGLDGICSWITRHYADLSILNKR